MTENADDEDRDQDRAMPTEAPHSLITYLHRVVDALDELPARYRLIVLKFVWLDTAAEARGDALAFPGGLDEERQRQVAALAHLMKDVVADPDLKAERLMREEDWEWMDRYLEQKFGKKDECSPPSTPAKALNNSASPTTRSRSPARSSTRATMPSG